MHVRTYVCKLVYKFPPPPHWGNYHSGYQQEPKINGTQCNERHLVKQSQLPDNQSPCSSREDKRKTSGTVSK